MPALRTLACIPFRGQVVSLRSLGKLRPMKMSFQELNEEMFEKGRPELSKKNIDLILYILD